MNQLRLGRGHVHHARWDGAKNSFRYPMFFLNFNCAREIDLRQTLQRRFHGLLSLSSRDYLAASDGLLEDTVKEFLRKNCGYEAEEVWLQTMPRMLGYVFNPVSFWLCRRIEKLHAVLVEVNNTFGERHYYWLGPRPGGVSNEWLTTRKMFHVSPFFPVEGDYRFRFQITEERSRIEINYHGPDGHLRLATSLEGVLSPLEQQSFSGLLAAYGWMTPLVIFRVHYQALKLLIKKSRFYSKPALPREEVTS